MKAFNEDEKKSREVLSKLCLFPRGKQTVGLCIISPHTIMLAVWGFISGRDN